MFVFFSGTFLDFLDGSCELQGLLKGIRNKSGTLKENKPFDLLMMNDDFSGKRCVSKVGPKSP